MPVLNEQNREETLRLIDEGMKNITAIRAVEKALEEHRKCVTQYEGTLDKLSRIRAGLQRELKALGYHDLGHARGEAKQQGLEGEGI